MVTLVQYMGVFAAILATSASNLVVLFAAFMLSETSRHPEKAALFGIKRLTNLVVLFAAFMLSDTKTLLDPSLLDPNRIAPDGS